MLRGVASGVLGGLLLSGTSIGCGSAQSTTPSLAHGTCAGRCHDENPESAYDEARCRESCRSQSIFER